MSEFKCYANSFKDKSISTKKKFLSTISKDQYEEFLTTVFYQENKNNKKLLKELHDLHQIYSKDIDLLNRYLYGNLNNYFNLNCFVRNINININQTLFLLKNININRFSEKNFESLVHIQEIDKDLIFKLAKNSNSIINSIIKMSLLSNEDIIKILESKDFKYSTRNSFLFNFIVNNINESNIKNLINNESFHWFVLLSTNFLFSDKSIYNQNKLYEIDNNIINFLTLYLKNSSSFRNSCSNEYNVYSNREYYFNIIRYLTNLVFI